MIKKIFFIVIFFSILFYISPQNNNKKSVNFKFYSKFYGKVGLRDKNDTSSIQIGLDKNTPKLSNDLLFSFVIKRLKNKRLILAPYIYSYFFTRFDYRKNSESTLFLERLGGIADAGIKIGYKFGKKKLKGSYFSFTLPLSVEYNLLYDKGTVFLPPPNADLSDFHTSVFIGSRLGFVLNLKLKKYFMRFKLNNTTSILADTISSNYTAGNDGFFFQNENTVNYQIAPFNFINKKVDVYLTLKNDFEFSLDSYNLGFDNEVSFEISWQGFKYVNIGYDPIIFKFESKLPLIPPQLLYDGLQRISMEVWIGAGYKFFWAKLSYEPVIFSIDKTDYNIDSVKPHYIKTYFEFKF